MSGHSKWSTIKRKKGAADAKRGQMFTKLIRELTVAARTGGGDPTGNPRLRTAILAARNQNMPKDNIENAIKKGTGELEGVTYEEAVYEGYGPGGVAILVNVMTDNKNRTAAAVRSFFSKCDGKMAAPNSVAYLFHKKGLISLDKEAVNEDQVMELALEAGAEDIKDDGVTMEIITDMTEFETVRDALEKNNIKYSNAEMTMIPDNTIQLEGKKAEQMLRLMEQLEDHEDVQNVYANFDISDEEMARING
jgi:YebC/PmpR family DNA-binding regulatory protein